MKLGQLSFVAQINLFIRWSILRVYWLRLMNVKCTSGNKNIVFIGRRAELGRKRLKMKLSWPVFSAHVERERERRGWLDRRLNAKISGDDGARLSLVFRSKRNRVRTFMNRRSDRLFRRRHCLFCHSRDPLWSGETRATGTRLSFSSPQPSAHLLREPHHANPPRLTSSRL
jgi:hypothetical protein